MNKFVLAALAAVAVATGASAEAADRRILVRNHSSEALVVLNGSNIARSSWEDNIIAGNPIRPGRSVVINFEDGSGYCQFDLRAIDASGNTVTRPNTNVCTTLTWTITD